MVLAVARPRHYLANAGQGDPFASVPYFCITGNPCDRAMKESLKIRSHPLPYLYDKTNFFSLLNFINSKL